MATYREIGIQYGLTGTKLNLYVQYMLSRWPDSEKQKCLDGYAGEWANRFLVHTEFNSSDNIGQSILSEIDPKVHRDNLTRSGKHLFDLSQNEKAGVKR